jgi:hypothetical protein
VLVAQLTIITLAALLAKASRWLSPRPYSTADWATYLPGDGGTRLSIDGALTANLRRPRLVGRVRRLR